ATTRAKGPATSFAPISTCAPAGAPSIWTACAPRSRAQRDRRCIECARAMLNTQPNIAAADDFYQELIDLHRDLTEEQSAVVNAKLVLLLANHVGDIGILREAMRAAREDVAASSPTDHHSMDKA